MHLKVHLADRTAVTTQLYFPDEVSAEVYADHPAYRDRGPKDTSNDADGFGGELDRLLLTVDRADSPTTATSTIGVARP